MSDPQTNEPVKPLPKAVQYVIVALMLAIFGGIVVLLRPETKACTTRSYTAEEDKTTCLMEGHVELVDDANRALNARELVGVGGGKLDYFHLVDDAGRALVFFKTEQHQMPAAGRRLKVQAKVLTETANGAPRLIAESWD